MRVSQEFFRAFAFVFALVGACLPSDATMPDLVIQSRTSASFMEFSPSGKLLATTGRGTNSLQFWDIETGKLLREVPIGRSTITNRLLAFTHEGRSITSCSDSGGAEIWDVESGTKIIDAIPSDCFSVAAHPKKRHIALGSARYGPTGRENFVRLFDLETRAPIWTVDAYMMLSLVFSKDGQRIFGGGYGNSILAFNTRDGKKTQFVTGLTKPVRQIAVSQDDKLVAGSDSDRVYVWNAKTGHLAWSVQVKNYGIAFSPKDNTLHLLVEIGQGGRAHRVVNGATGKPVAGGHDEPTRSWAIAIGLAANVVALGNDSDFGNGGIEIRDLKSRSLVSEIKSRVSNQSFVAFHPSAPILAVAGDVGLRAWDLSTLAPIKLKNPDTSTCNIPKGLIFGGKNDTLVGSIGCGQLYRFLLSQGTYEAIAPPLESYVGQPEISPDGLQLFAMTVGCKSDHRCPKEVLAVSLLDRTVKWRVSIPAGDQRTNLSVSPDGEVLAVVAKTLLLLDTKTGRQTAERSYSRKFLPTQRLDVEPLRVAFSKQGKLAVAYGSTSIIEYHDARANEGTILLQDSFETTAGFISGLAYSPNSELLVAGRSDGKLLFLRKGRVQEVIGHLGQVTSLSFSGDGQRIASAGDDAAVRVWNAATGELLTTLVQVDKEDYVFVSPSGTYTATPGGLAGVGFRRHGRVYPFEQFDLQLNRPAEVLRSLGTGKDGAIEALNLAWLKRLRKSNLSEHTVQLSEFLPTARIIAKGAEMSTQKSEITVRIRAEDTNVPLHALRVMVNDVPIGGTKGIPLKPRIGAVEIDVPIELSLGRNTIRVSAINVNGVESLSESFHVTKEGERTKTDLYVLVVGVSKYKNAEMNLQYAAKDASDLAALFEKNEPSGKVHVVRLLDHDATKERIVAAKKFLLEAKVDDRVVVFIAGHGVLDQNSDYYFATTDTDFQDPAKRGLSFSDVEDLLDGLRSRNKLLLVDSCNSGEIDSLTREVKTAIQEGDGVVKRSDVRGLRYVSKRIDAETSVELMSTLFTDLRRGSGASVIAATSGAEYAFESERLQNGVFSYSILTGLESGSADLNSDGRVTVNELRDHVSSAVLRLTAGAQKPSVRRESRYFDFEVSAEDYSLAQYRGLSWESGSFCIGTKDIAACECHIREAKKFYKTPFDSIRAFRKFLYAAARNMTLPDDASVLATISKTCNYPSRTDSVDGLNAVCPKGMAKIPRPNNTVSRSSNWLCLDQTEVTVSEFQRCVIAGACKPAAANCERSATFDAPDKQGHPMNCVSWDESDKYCRWTGNRLPTAEEWTWAAQGGELMSKYPWGNDMAQDLCWKRWTSSSHWAGTCPVGWAKGDRSPHGIFDLGGNVGEWTSTDGKTKNTKIVKGGGWADDSDENGLVASEETELDRNRRHGVIGFRCANGGMSIE